MSIEEVQLLRLEPDDIQSEELNEDAENSLSLSCRGTSELSVGKRQDVDPSSIIAHNSQACPALVHAHTGLTQELKGLKIIDDTGVKGSAEGYLSDGVPETTKTCSVESENILCDNADGSTETGNTIYFPNAGATKYPNRRVE